MFHFTGPYEYHTPPSEYNQYISQNQQYYQVIQKKLSNWFKPGMKKLSNWFKPGINRQTPPVFVLPIIAVIGTFAVGAAILICKFIFDCYLCPILPKTACRKSCCFSIYQHQSVFTPFGSNFCLKNENSEFVLIYKLVENFYGQKFVVD